jgi:hypothetical protein
MRRALVCLVCLTFAGALPATADTTPSFGLRGGFTLSPDQIHIGAHVKALELSRDFMFVPNVEFGFGDNVTLIAINAEVAYTIPNANWSGWHPYVGGGLGFNIWDYHAGWPHYHEFGYDTSESDVGLNLLFGVQKVLNIGHEFFFELKLGLVDSPDAKFTFGLTFF